GNLNLTQYALRERVATRHLRLLASNVWSRSGICLRLRNETKSLLPIRIINIFYNLSDGPPIASYSLVDGPLTLSSADATNAPLNSPVTILVVDDEPLVRSMLESVLTRRGYSVLMASCGHEA